MPRQHFPKSVLKGGIMEADDYRALIYQLSIVIGDDPAIIPDDQVNPTRGEVASWLWLAVTTFDSMWDISGHTDGDLRTLHVSIKDNLMAGMKIVFPTHSLKKIKFHFNLHNTDNIRWFGSLRLIDSRFGEATHQETEASFSRTRRHHDSAREETSNHLNRRLKMKIAGPAAELPKSARSRAAAEARTRAKDQLLGKSVSFEYVSVCVVYI
jgi:hypothetical protein